jgi:hypothetical protein
VSGARDLASGRELPAQGTDRPVLFRFTEAVTRRCGDAAGVLAVASEPSAEPEILRRVTGSVQAADVDAPYVSWPRAGRPWRRRRSTAASRPAPAAMVSRGDVAVRRVASPRRADQRDRRSIRRRNWRIDNWDDHRGVPKDHVLRTSARSATDRGPGCTEFSRSVADDPEHGRGRTRGCRPFRHETEDGRGLDRLGH